MKTKINKKVCCICREEYEGEGNNPDPVRKTGRCCDYCNANIIIPARIKQFTKH